MAHSSAGPAPREGAGPLLSTRSTAWPWTLALVLLVVAVILSANLAGLTGLLEYAGLVAIIGLGLGIGMGSPEVRPRERGAIGFAIGFIGTVAAVVISVFIVASLGTERVEVIPALVALVAGVIGLVAGTACALGTLIGGFLRGWLSRTVTSA